MIDLENKMDALLDEIREMIHEKRYADLRDMFLPMESADIAQILEAVSYTHLTLPTIA